MKATLIALISIFLLVMAFNDSEKKAANKRNAASYSKVKEIAQSESLNTKSEKKMTTYPEDYAPKKSGSLKLDIVVVISLVVLLFTLALFGAKPNYAAYDSPKRAEKKIRKEDLFRNQINTALDNDGFPQRPIARLLITELMRESRDYGDPYGKIHREIAKVYEENGLDINK